MVATSITTSSSSSCFVVVLLIVALGCFLEAHAFVIPRPMVSVSMSTTSSSSSSSSSGLFVSSSSPDVMDLGKIISNAKEALENSLIEGATTAAKSSPPPAVAGNNDLFINDELIDNAHGLLSSLPVKPELILLVVLFVGAHLITEAVKSAGEGSSASSSTSSQRPQKGRNMVDVSIPYDAAARLAYDAWCQQHGDVKAASDEKAFAQFKALYEETAVAQVTAKQKARDMTNFDPNKPPKPAAPKAQAPAPAPVPTTPPAKKATVVASKKGNDAVPFFANMK